MERVTTSLETRTFVKRTLLVTGILLVLWHIATASYLTYLDWQWKIADDRTPWVSTSIMMLVSWILVGVIFLIGALWIVYEAFKTEYKSRTRQVVACLSICLIVAAGIAISYTNMVIDVLAGEKPEDAATNAFIFIFGLGTEFGLGIFLVLFLWIPEIAATLETS